MTNPTPETLAELRRLLDVANSERVMTASLEMDYSLMRKSTRALFIAAVNALPDLLNAAAERDALGAAVERVRALHSPWCHKHSGPWGPGHTDPSCFEYCFECAQDGPCPTILALDATPTGGGA